MAEKWISGAIRRPGALTRKAEAAGESVGQFARGALAEGSKASTTTKRQAALALTLRRLARRKK